MWNLNKTKTFDSCADFIELGRDSIISLTCDTAGTRTVGRRSAGNFRAASSAASTLHTRTAVGVFLTYSPTAAVQSLGD